MDRIAGLIRYRVTIRFEDGVYEGAAWSGSDGGAFNLALIDARMAKPTQIYSGKVLGWDAVKQTAWTTGRTI